MSALGCIAIMSGKNLSDVIIVVIENK